MILAQQKTVAPGDVRTWELDLEAAAGCASWTRRNPDLLSEELARILTVFPTLVAAVGVPLGQDRCWVEAAEPLLCPGCSELVVFDHSTRCARCQQPVPVPTPAMVGVVGRIPALISGRPFETRLLARLAELRAENGPAASASLLEIGDYRYFAPRFSLWFSQSWPRTDPPVMIWPEYFNILDVLPDHVYCADQYYRLCLFSTWREQPAVQVLQNRVVPRLLIDLMVADLRAVGRLDEALDSLDMSLYDLYNEIGKPEKAEPIRKIYEQLVAR
jgi:hypothetical protein